MMKNDDEGRRQHNIEATCSSYSFNCEL